MEALLARLRLLRGRSCSIESSGRKRKGLCLSADGGLRTELGSELGGQRMLRRKKLLFGDWGTGEVMARDHIPRAVPREVGGPGSCGEGAAVCSQAVRIGAPLFLPTELWLGM